jgi:glutamate/tyrosine decarboxylase-like PLP-dependent enzyme
MSNALPFAPAAWFPGPHSENEAWVRAEFQSVLDHWFDWRKGLFESDPLAVTAEERRSIPYLAERECLAQHLNELCEALTAEIPTYTPRYIGHMKAELSLPALFGWFAAMLHNPNITSKEAGKVGTIIETEAIAMLAEMLGFDPEIAQGHFTSGGTLANFEGMWRARYRLDHWLALALYIAETTNTKLDVFAAAHMGWTRFRKLWAQHNLCDDTLKRYSAVASNPADIYRRISRASGRDYLGPIVLVPGNKHYSWRKAANIFGLGEASFWSVALDDHGRLDLADFERLAFKAEEEARPILMAVSVAGTTETGEIDPIDRQFELLDAWKQTRGWRIWHHVDAAYGGFLCSLLDGEAEGAISPACANALRAIARADSVTIDPHKLGYVPYACGAFLARDTDHYVVSGFDAPYLDRPQLGAGKWSSTLEGSRSAAGAAATWLTGKAIGFGPDRFGALLAETIASRRAFQTAMTAALPSIRFLEPADANIVCFWLATDGEALSASNRRTEALYDALLASPEFSVSKTTLGADYAAQMRAHLARYGGVEDRDGLVMIRCVFMNPYWSVPAFREALFPQFIALVRQIAEI